MTEDPLGIDYMCPFCVTPWKCNGPHIDVDDLPAFRLYMDDVAADLLTEAIQAVYKDCHHTKYVGCRPCPHDEIAERLRGIKPRLLEDDTAWDNGYKTGVNHSVSTIVDYIDEFHKHVGDLTCQPFQGDTCDMSAAVRVAVNRVKKLLEVPDVRPSE
jgi:hypothetical protein